MTGRELWEQYQHYTRDLTEHGRKLGFAGAAICWVFKKDDFTFPLSIYLALFSFVAYFFADILQSFLAAVILKLFTEYHEKKLWKETKTIEGEILKPKWIDWPAFILFISKNFLLLIGFGFIGFHLSKILIAKKIAG